MNKRLFELYLKDVNHLDFENKRRFKRLSIKRPGSVETLLIKIIGACIGIMTMNALVHQMVMQYGRVIR